MTSIFYLKKRLKENIIVYPSSVIREVEQWIAEVGQSESSEEAPIFQCCLALGSEGQGRPKK